MIPASMGFKTNVVETASAHVLDRAAFLHAHAQHNYRTVAAPFVLRSTNVIIEPLQPGKKLDVIQAFSLFQYCSQSQIIALFFWNALGFRAFLIIISGISSLPEAFQQTNTVRRNFRSSGQLLHVPILCGQGPFGKTPCLIGIPYIVKSVFLNFSPQIWQRAMICTPVGICIFNTHPT